MIKKKQEDGTTPLYTKDVADILGVSFNTVRYFVAHKIILPTGRIKNLVVFDRKDVLALKKEREKKASQQGKNQGLGKWDKKKLVECEKKYLSQGQAAGILGLSFRTIRALVDGKQLAVAEIACQKRFFTHSVVLVFKKKREKKLQEQADRVKKRIDDKAKKKELRIEASRERARRKEAEKQLKLAKESKLFSIPPKPLIVKEIQAARKSKNKNKQKHQWRLIDRRNFVEDPYYQKEVDFDYEVYKENKNITELEKLLVRIDIEDVQQKKAVRLNLIKAVYRRRQKLDFLKVTNIESYENTIEKIGLEQ